MYATVAQRDYRTLARRMREWTFVDVLVTSYHVILVAAAIQGTGPGRAWCIHWTGSLLALQLATVLAVRSRLLGTGRMAGLLYRVVTYGTVQVSYFVLRTLLPTARETALDAALFDLDVKLFGVEPTLWLDRFVTPACTEWFAFFYFGYFPLLAVHVLPMLFLERRTRLLAEFAMGILVVFCTAQIVYMLVPGFGPYRHLATHFEHALPHGRWYDLVLAAVAAGGAQKDIFPSVHTAAPTFLAIFSFLNRDRRPFSFTWPITALFAANIIGATIFLRWHYAIDVVAGLTLATFAANFAHRVSGREEDRRAASEASPAWAALWRPAESGAPCCRRCGAKGVRALYSGLPMWLCSRPQCPTVWGAFSVVPLLFGGRVFVRFEGSYAQALFFWLANRPPRDERRDPS
jgi:hypothetical protein